MNLKQTLQQNRQDLQQQFEQEVDILTLLKSRSQTIDQLLNEMWQKADLDVSQNVSLVAVGGYGREQMHPASDVDLLILLKDEPDAKAQEQLSDFVTVLWDLGLEIGHSVRTLEECVDEAKKDQTIITNLIESRFLCGNESLFEQLKKTITPDKIWSSAEFFKAKLEEQKNRYKRFGDTAYRVEPNLKEGPGGLRDLQMIGWITQREFGTYSLRALSELPSELPDIDLLNPEEYHDLIESRDFLWQVRFVLHQFTGRKEDRLLFDHQRHLAHAFGYTDDTDNLSIETFMQRYYRHIYRLERLNEVLLGLLRERILKDSQAKPIKINQYYCNQGGYLGLSQQGFIEENPHALLEVFYIIQTHPDLKGMTPNTIREIRRHLHLIDDEFRNSSHNKQIFINIMSHTQGINFALRRMNRYGVLAAYIPAFENIVGRMQYDLFHAYTVDEHTLNVVRNIRRLSTAIGAEELPFCSEIFHTLKNPMILYLGGLFHDIAKGRGGSHSEKGAVDALEFCLAHELDQASAETVSWLVKQHLVLSSTAQRKDISDPDVIKEIADLAQTQTRMDYLYLLTICDIRGTNPTLLNNWKHSLLKSLYRNVRRYLDNQRADSKSLMIKQKKEYLSTHEIDMNAYGAFLERFDDDYIEQYPAEELLKHFNYIQKDSDNSDNSKAIIKVITPKSADSSHLFIYAKDQDALFVKITSAIEQQNLNILAANISSSQDDYALNTFYLLTNEGTPIANQQDKEKLMQNVLTNLQQADFSPSIQQSALSRQHKHFKIKTKVNFEQNNNSQHTAIQIITADKAGLLTHIANVFNQQGLEIHHAKITTLGEIAEDTFQITTKSGEAVDDKSKQAEIRSALLASLE